MSPPTSLLSNHRGCRDVAYRQRRPPKQRSQGRIVRREVAAPRGLEDPEKHARVTRARILAAASTLIANGGIAALTTRAVAAAGGGGQAPTLYRLFGDKRGLLNAVAEHGLAAFHAAKIAISPHPDLVQTLRDAWDGYVRFGLANPAVFAITNEVGAPASGSPAMLAGLAILRERVERVARAGRLTIPVERAVALIHAAGVGTVTTLLASSETERDPTLSTAARDAVLAATTVDLPAGQYGGLARLAIGLRAHLDAAKGLTPGERQLLDELLDRLSQPISDQENASGRS